MSTNDPYPYVRALSLLGRLDDGYDDDDEEDGDADADDDSHLKLGRVGGGRKVGD